MREDVVPILRVDNVARSVAWYERLGFRQEWEHRFEPELPAFASVARGNFVCFSLSIRVTPGRTLWFTCVSWDVAPIAKEFGATAEDQPWGMREIELRDLDGNRLRIGSPIS